MLHKVAKVLSWCRIMSVFTRNFADVNTSKVIAITNFGILDVIGKGEFAHSIVQYIWLLQTENKILKFKMKALVGH
jgi:hypothetical protein